MSKKNKLFLGVTLGRRTDWERYFTTPTAPKNYTDPKKIEKYVQDRLAEQEEQAAFTPLAGTVHTCVVTDMFGELVINKSAGFETPEGLISYQVLNELSHRLLQTSPDLAPDDSPFECGALLFGLNIRDRLRSMALDAMSYISKNPEVVTHDIPVRLWYSLPFTPGIWCDPYEAVIPSDRRKDVPYNGLCDFLGISIPEGSQLDANARLQADVARQIAQRAQLTARPSV